MVFRGSWVEDGVLGEGGLRTMGGSKNGEREEKAMKEIVGVDCKVMERSQERERHGGKCEKLEEER